MVYVLELDVACMYLRSTPYNVVLCMIFFVQAEDGIRDLVRSRGLGDGYKRQAQNLRLTRAVPGQRMGRAAVAGRAACGKSSPPGLSLIHI